MSSFVKLSERWLRIGIPFVVLSVFTMLRVLVAQEAKQEDPTLDALKQLAAQVEAVVHQSNLPAFAPPQVLLDTQPQISFYEKHTVHSSRFGKLPAQVQSTFDQWASYTTDQPSGQELFEAMFYRFFFVHELGHWVSIQLIRRLPEDRKKVVSDNFDRNYWQVEMTANRIAVAWYRERDPEYLAKLVNDFRRIRKKLPSPVSSGQDERQYFNANYATLGDNPTAYGWYQLEMVILASEEPPRTFEQVMRGLPQMNYEN